MNAQITSPGDVREFLLAGNATLTLVSKKTGTRYTYRVRVPEDLREHRDARDVKKIYFVSLLTGSDNENSYTYIGQIFSDAVKYTHGKKSRLTLEAPGVKAFEWFARMVLNPSAPDLPASLEVWHEGRCGRCNRLLTVPESIARGIGPECAGKMSATWVKPANKPKSKPVHAVPFNDEIPTW